MTCPGSPGPETGAGDEALLRALADAVALADPVPAAWPRAARAGADWLAIDAEPAELAYDSLDDTRPAGTAPREGSERRRLRYDAAGVTVEVELSVTADALGLAGRVAPPGPWPVRALQPEGSHTVDAGESGAFQFDELPRSPVSLVVGRRPAVKTGWIVP